MCWQSGAKASRQWGAGGKRKLGDSMGHPGQMWNRGKAVTADQAKADRGGGRSRGLQRPMKLRYEMWCPNGS